MNHLNLNCTKGKLKNGLEYILYEDKSIPLVSVNIWYKVGSAYETKGKTGLAHLFEHMMFQGSANVPKEMHFRYIQEAGGTLNGSTSSDRTNYYEKLPANNLELALWLESDRMGFFLPALTEEKLNNQKDVVKNERLERYDNQPYGLAWELLITNLYPESHPYSWSTIGFLKDIESYTFEDVKNFFQKYYSPNNACLVIAGDFEKDNAISLITKYFEPIQPFDNNHKINFPVPSLKENIFIQQKDNVQLDRIYLAWHSDFIYGLNDAPLEVVSDILSGSKNSRLYKKLVFDLQIAQDVTAFQYSGKFGGHFMIISTARPGINLDRLKEVILNEINELIKNGVSPRELEKSKNGIKAHFIYSMQNLDTVADYLNHYNYYLNEPNSFEFDLNRYNKVDNDTIKNAAALYLTKPFVELRITPKENSL
ncbi:MAG TPA: pitrilysin family protein [Ignavibacteriaceae bacterium]|nr:pitrilysin family protein [Ignavibacteriaceae bacterium]